MCYWHNERQTKVIWCHLIQLSVNLLFTVYSIFIFRPKEASQCSMSKNSTLHDRTSCPHAINKYASTLSGKLSTGMFSHSSLSELKTNVGQWGQMLDGVEVEVRTLCREVKFCHTRHGYLSCPSLLSWVLLLPQRLLLSKWSLYPLGLRFSFLGTKDET